MTIVPAIKELLKEQGAGDILLVAGGTIPQEDVRSLKAQNAVDEVFLPGTETDAIVNYIRSKISA